MTLHIFRARDQPATRYSFTLDMPDGPETMWIVNRRRKVFFCFTCKQRRWAGNLTAHVYYDNTYFYCKPGKGCKHGRRSKPSSRRRTSRGVPRRRSSSRRSREARRR